MPSNPIQRKTRNAFLSGMLIMLLVVIAIATILYFTVLTDMFGTSTTGKGEAVYVYRLLADIKSGEQIDLNKIEKVKLYTSDIPTDYVKDASNISEYKSKLNLKKGTVLSSSLLYKKEALAKSTRLMEYNMLTLPSSLKRGDYIDIRFTLPSGQNYIVLSKKQVINIKDTTVILLLTEDEILMMSSAIIESYTMKASDLRAVKYVEAGMQEASTPTYAVNNQVYQLIMSNYQKGVNIEDYGKINDSYNTGLRAIIDQELGQYSGTELSNIQEGIEEEREKSMELYLSGLAGY